MKRLSIRRHTTTAFVVGSLAALAFTATVLAGRPVDQHLLNLINTPNNHYPEMAMRVDGQAVTGQFVEAAVARIMDNAASQGRAVSRHDAQQAVIDHLVRRAALVDEAHRRGFTASDSEVTVYLARQVALKQQDPNQAAANAIETANGDASDVDYSNDPQVRAGVADQIAATKLLDSVSAGSPNFDVDTFVSSLTSNVSVELFFTP